MLCRTLAWTLLAAAGFATAAATTATGQDAGLPDKPAGLFEDVNKFRREGFANSTDLAKAKRAFANFATYHAKLIASPAVYRAPQEFRPDNKVPSLDKINDDLNSRIAVPELGGRVGVESVSYIRELGAALDAALAPVVKDDNAPPIVRINAARLLATACRSGAPAHWPSVTALLADGKTPPEVRFYLLKAAENLLAAQDPVNSIIDTQTREATFQSRKHAVPTNDLIQLVLVIDKMVTTPAALVPGLPDGATVASLTPNDQAVVQYLRRQAIRALAQCRLPSIEGAGDTAVYPAYTLARITMNDPALVLPPYAKKDVPPDLKGKAEEEKAWVATEAALARAAAGRRAVEAAEATFGLCNMWAPVGYNGDAAADAVAAGLLAFADLRIGDPNDKTVPWRTYASRLDEAVKFWQMISSQGFDPRKGMRQPNLRQPNEFIRRVVTAATSATGLLTELEAVGPDGRAVGNPRREELLAVRDDIRKAPNRSKTMFQDVDKTPMDFRAAPPVAAPPAKK